MKTLTIHILLLFLVSCTALQSQITYQNAFPNIDFEFPTEIQNANDGSNRLFVVEQRGRIEVFPNQNNVTSTSNFLDITDRVRFRNGQEVGLLGLAFHPQYTSNGYIYVYYTTDSPVSGISVRMVLSRFSINPSNNNDVLEDSELVIFQFDKNQNNSNHNGGKIAFGPDGYLYISIGDGGGGNDPQRNGQNKNTVFGSLLRIDVDLDGSNPVENNPIAPNGNYEIPSDNPLVGSSGLDEIYVYGIRNTWKFAFDQVTGRCWGADVGQNALEEINIIESGKNYGWSRFEANSVANSNVIISEPTEFPVFFYNRNQGDRSITGGYVYRGSEITSLNPDIQGKYIFGDYVSGRVWALNYNPSTGDASRTLLFNTTNEFVSSFGLDESGELYFSDYGTNAQLYKLVDGTSSSSGTAVNGIGKWNMLNEGVINGIVNDIATAPNGNVYHAGTFSQAGTISANNIAVWNQTSGWQSLGSGANGTINALAIAPNGNIYAGGSFTEIGGITANNIAIYNGSSWSALGSGVDGTVAAMALLDNGDLYVGGVFETASGNTVRNIALWNGSQWSSLTDTTTTAAGTNNEIRALVIDTDGTLYVGGNFDEAGGNTANRIATWNGTNWGALGSGTSGFVEAIAVTPTEIYIGGNFAIAGGQTVNRIARWNKNTTSWSSLDNGVNNIVNTLIHDGTYLYAAGAFDNANVDTNNRIIVNNIARWSATGGWEALGTGTNVGVDIKINTVSFASDTDGVNKLYAGGNFTSAGAINASNTAEWVSENNQIPDTQAPSDPTNLTANNITSNSVTLNWTAATDNQGVTQYNISLDGNNIGTSANTTFNLTELASSTAYSVSVTAQDAAGNISGSATVSFTTTNGPAITYCDSASTNINDEFISRVQINTIDNTSGAQFYSNFSTISTDLGEGQNYSITVTPTWTGTIYPEGYAVWIDYNNNGDFTDAGELVWSKSPTTDTNNTGTFTIPTGTALTSVRMRVSMKYNDIPTSCETFTYGEVEDYTINLEEGNGQGGGGVIAAYFFETGLDGWTDGGSDCARINNSGRAFEGNFSIRLRDNSASSNAVSPVLDLTGNAEVSIEFHTFAVGMENGEDYFIEFFNGSSYEIIGRYITGTDFTNGSFFTDTITLDSGTYNFNANNRFRIRCDASVNNDQVYFDQIVISGDNARVLRSTPIEDPENGTEQHTFVENALKNINLYPNPASTQLNIEIAAGSFEEITILSSTGAIAKQLKPEEGTVAIDISDFASGMYFIRFVSKGLTVTKKFVKK